MKKTFKVCVVLLGIMAVSATALSLWARNPVEKLVNRAVEEAEKRIGRDITIGKFGGNPFTGFGIRDLSIKPKIQGTGDTLSIGSLKFSVSLPMLLQRKVVFKKIELLNPVISIERFANGENSVSDILEAMKTPEGEKKKPPTVFFQTISLRNMTMAVKLHGEQGEPVEIVVTPVNLLVEPTEADSYENFKLKLDGKLESLELTGSGVLQMVPELFLKMEWKTNRFETGKLPDFLSVYFDKAEIIGLKTSAVASGVLQVMKGKMVSDSRLSLKDTEALDQKFGDGFLKVLYVGEELQFEGNIGKTAPVIKGNGMIRTGEKPAFNTMIDLGGIDVTPAVRMLLKDTAPDVLSGTLSGNIHANGPGLDMKKLNTDGNLVVKRGTFNYPTPVIKGEGGGRAPINFDRIDLTLNHRQPNIGIRDMRITAPGMAASARGVISYGTDKKTGAAAGPVSFDLKINAESRDVEELLKLNKYVGPAVSGKLTASGGIKGNSADMKSLVGAITFALLDGTVVNPYMEKSSKLPLNANLSHFDFDSIKGILNVSNGVVSTQSIRLLSSLINADVRGSIAFDGPMNGHAVASLEPSALASIADFKSVLPQVNDRLKGLERVDTSFELGGTVQKPVIHWNADEFAKNIGKKVLENQADKAVDKMMDNLDKKIGGEGAGGKADSVKKKLKDKLKGIF